jgi:hypothetical protein
MKQFTFRFAIPRIISGTGSHSFLDSETTIVEKVIVVSGGFAEALKQSWRHVFAGWVTLVF